MNNRKEMIFKKAMNRSADFKDVWDAGDQYFFAAEKEEYRSLSEDEIIALLKSAREIQNVKGLLPLYEDPEMPGDARVDMIYRPSYAISAVSIYAYLKWPEAFDRELIDFMKKLLEGTYCRGIIGHGIEAPETVRRTLEVLCKAGVRDFVEKYPDFCPSFTKMIRRYMMQMKKLSDAIDNDGYIATENDFSAKSINHKFKRLAALWERKRHPVFVYGTLMQGERAHDLLEKELFAGSYLLRDYAMYDLGSFPGIKPLKGESVLGELYYVDYETLAKLDAYEGNGILYQRTSVKITSASAEIDAETYLYSGNIDGRQLLREAWGCDDSDLVWYAGYGSNLSSKRFDCYIKGGICEENDREYHGCRDKNAPLATEMSTYKGRLYFGNQSGSWNGCGVAFYDPDGDEQIYMKRYLITREQLHEVMAQEGDFPNWYGCMICLDVDDHGIPVYTLTSESTRPENAPDPAYVALMIDSLVKDFRMNRKQAEKYVESRMR